jgi:hypothetical protein
MGKSWAVMGRKRLPKLVPEASICVTCRFFRAGDQI